MFPSTKRKCFIIGPMKDAIKRPNTRLHLLAREILAPLLREVGEPDGITYEVITPYDLEGSGKIMYDVLYAIDRADLVVADLTDSNANVFYELGITHSLGRACITVMEQSYSRNEFDIADYRVYRINLEESRFQEAQQILRGVVQKVHQDLANWKSYENPVIDFFQAPITYISPAYSLAYNYYHNFVKPVVEAMIIRRGKGYIYDIGLETELGAHSGRMEDTRLFDPTEREALRLRVIVPVRIEYARRNFADRFRDQLLQALVEGNGRTYTCFYRGDEGHHLIDLPTTIRVLEDAVDRRMRDRNTPSDHPEWRGLERQEIERFILNLQLLIDRHERGREFSNRVSIELFDSDAAGNLGWLADILAL